MKKIRFFVAVAGFLSGSFSVAGPQISCVYQGKSPSAIGAKCGGPSCGSAYVCFGVVDCTETLSGQQTLGALATCPAKVIFPKGCKATDEKCLGGSPEVSCPSATDCARDSELIEVRDPKVLETSLPDPTAVRPLGGDGL